MSKENSKNNCEAQMVPGTAEFEASKARESGLSGPGLAEHPVLIEGKQMVLGRGFPKLCVPVVGSTIPEFLEQLELAVAAAPDLVELRVDTLMDLTEAGIHKVIHEADRILKGRIPVLLTYRTARDGGNGDASPERFAELFSSCMDLPFDLLDLEISLGDAVFLQMRDLAREAGKKVIASWHSFQETPDESTLLSLFDHMEALGADAAKVAVMPRQEQDVDRLMDAAKQASNRLKIPIIAISMGELGMRTRLECAAIGSCLTFASAGAGSAPGQMGIEEVRMAIRNRS